jgi:hypothetical protein
MTKEKGEQGKSFEKEKVLTALKSLIHNTNATLNTKYLKSHSKVAIFYQDHIIELHGGEEKFVKYMSLKVPITPSEHKEILAQFLNEEKRRAEDSSLKKLDQLRKLVGNH